MALIPIDSGNGTTADPRETKSTTMTPGTFGLPWFVRTTATANQPQFVGPPPVSTTDIFYSNLDRLLAVRNADRRFVEAGLPAPQLPGADITAGAVIDRNAAAEKATLMSPKVITPAMRTTLGSNYTDADITRGAKDYIRIQNITNRPFDLDAAIRSLEEALPTYQDQAAAKAYGNPIGFTKDSLGNDVPIYADNAPVYLGLQVGQIGGVMPNPPSENASDLEKQNYYNALKSSFNVPQYTEASIINEFMNMDKQTVAEFQKKLHYMGIYPPNSGFTYGEYNLTDAGYMKTLMTLANMNGTDWAYQLDLQFNNFNERVKQGLSSPYGGGGTGGGGGGGGAAGTSSVYRNVQYSSTSLSQARALLISVMQDALGRNPTDAEIRRFTQLLNGEERNSPSVTVTKTKYVTDSKTRAVSRTTPSSVDPERLAMEFVQSIDQGTPYDNSQANRYVDALVNWLGG